ncbi:MAG: cytochrome c [SAR202 cluster bacterium]|nr:cytochrome c [SAR202 cluster bacterium]
MKNFRTNIFVLLIVLSLSVFLTACYNNNTGDVIVSEDIRFKLPAFPETGSHAVVVFSEMHYQPSFGSQEIPRILPVADSVPITGAEIDKSSMEEYSSWGVPQRVIDDWNSDPDNVVSAQKLFATNCQVCHGHNLDGNGPIVQFDHGSIAPRSLLDTAATSATDGELFGYISFGGRSGLASAVQGNPTPSWMPQFRYLLTEDERWKLVMYLRGVQQNPAE